jgi:Cu/Ag efflux pump CusA
MTAVDGTAARDPETDPATTRRVMWPVRLVNSVCSRGVVRISGLRGLPARHCSPELPVEVSVIASLVGSAVRRRRVVVACLVLVLGFALAQLRNATTDTYPEFGGTTVQVQAEALGLSAQEVEQLITVPIEQDLLNGVPWVDSITSRSMPGLSAIELRFAPGTDLYEARQMVQERMSQAKVLPNVGTPPAVIQPTSSTGRVAMVALRSQSVSLVDLSVMARWTIRPRLMSIPGVSQVSIWGQQDRQLQVRVDPQQLRASNVTLTQLIDTTGNALWVSPLGFVEASHPGTGGFVETPSQRLDVQHASPITTADDLAQIAIGGVPGAPVRLGDVTTVVEDHPPLIGDASDAGRPSLMLVVQRFPDADTAQVTHDVEAALGAIEPGLPGVTVDTSLYQPERYVDSAVRRVGLAALLGLLLLAVVVAVLDRSWRTALITVVALTTSIAAALAVLSLRGATLTSMTLLGLAAVAVLVVDDAIGDVARLRPLLRRPREAEGLPLADVGAVVRARRGPLTVATLVTLLALGPLVLLPGPAGALVRPALLTFALVLAAASVVALVVTPALAALLYRGPATGGHTSATPGWAGRGLDRLAARSGRPRVAAAGLAVLLLLALPAVASLRAGDTLPSAEDRDVVVHLKAAPGTALSETNRITGAVAAGIGELAGVRSVGTHVGRAVASDRVVDVDSSEIWLTLADDADYRSTLAAVRTTVRAYPGLRSEVTTYADAQLAAAGSTTGERLVVRVYGQDPATLRATAQDVQQEIQTVPGVLAPAVQPQVTEPSIEIQVDLAAAQQVGLRPGDVRRDASTLISGLTVGRLYQADAAFDVVLWGGPPSRESVSDLQALLLDTPSGQRVRLGDVAQVRIAATPTVITHDAVSRMLDVTAEVRGRTAADVSADVTAHLRRMDFPYEYRAEVVGDALSRGQTRLGVLGAALVAGLLCYLLLQSATGSWRGAAVLLLPAPLAAVGGLLAAQLTGGVATGGVLAGLVAVAALALRQALVLVRRAQALREADVGVADAVRRAVREQAPPVLGTALAAAALVLPAAVIGGGAGLELLHPFAVTLLGGLVTSVLVVLVVVPGLYPALAGLQPVPIPPDLVGAPAVDRAGVPAIPGPRVGRDRHEQEERS